MHLVIRLLRKFFMMLFKKTPVYKKAKTTLTVYLLGMITSAVIGIAAALLWKNRTALLSKLRKLRNRAK